MNLGCASGIGQNAAPSATLAVEERHFVTHPRTEGFEQVSALGGVQFNGFTDFKPTKGIITAESSHATTLGKRDTDCKDRSTGQS
ncbi:hypothetical protein GCM10007047_11170 [Cerasicoccus arenae]|uniref:Uncharacterized protein n=1 Tax=Cerasicoccus arenae TaxID=424488 RepID=A0A8J3DEH9_9BACT|nr:hypothetical protein [Cerasicoccus arenae]GHB96963.1 hypothetical protein GCM10007047_11170 [Cerasicoccus arenae]